MRYLTAHHTWLRKPPAVEAPDSALGTWLRVSAWCADNETGRNAPSVSRRSPLGEAVIPGFKKWKQRACVAAMGTTPAAVNAMVTAGLGMWEGDSLVILGYDVYAQAAYARTRHRDDKERVQAPAQERVQAPAQERVQAPAQEPVQAPAQGRAEQSRANMGQSTSGKDHPGEGGAALPPDDESAPDCVGDLVERNDEEAPMPSTGSRLDWGLR
jgi:hypothetical protein